jgi:phage-related baseplate assembly protein
MPRFSPVDLSLYPISDVVEALDFEAYLARDRAEFTRRWELRRQLRPDLPAVDTLLLETDPASVVLEAGAYRETLLRAEINDRIRSLTLAGALGRALDHIGVTYLRTARRTGEDDETYRQRLAIAPEAWSTAGPHGAYLFWGVSASADLLDIAAYSEDEGCCLAPHVRIAVLPRPGLTPQQTTALVADVSQALNREDRRPLGDLVTVELAEPAPFDVAVTVTVRPGASAAPVVEAARRRVLAYCSGRLRWIGDDQTGPVWLIGRQMRVESIAAAASGGDPNIVEVDVASPAADVNAPHASYQASLSLVGQTAFAPPPEAVTAHLFRAPVLGAVTIAAAFAAGSWS